MTSMRSWVQTNLVDINKLPLNPFVNRAWIRHVFPMPYRLDEDEDYKCLTKEFFDALCLTVNSTDKDNKLFVLNFETYGTELATFSPNVPFYWSIDFDWVKLCEIMDQQDSISGLYMWDSRLQWALVTVANEYLIFGGAKEIINEFEQHYKSAEQIALDMVKSINNKHTFFGEDASTHLPDKYRFMIKK
jgi:hypothetical protein